MNLEYLGWPYREYIKTAKNGSFCEELLSEKYFETVSANFCCYDYGANASEAVQKTGTKTKDTDGVEPQLTLKQLILYYTYEKTYLAVYYLLAGDTIQVSVFFLT